MKSIRPERDSEDEPTREHSLTRPDGTPGGEHRAEGMPDVTEPSHQTPPEGSMGQVQQDIGEDLHKSFAELSPSQVRENVKTAVRKGVAGIAGALEGLNEEIEEDHLPEKTERAIHNVGETTRKVASAAREETRETRDQMKSDKDKNTQQQLGGGLQESSETGRSGAKPVRRRSQYSI